MTVSEYEERFRPPARSVHQAYVDMHGPKSTRRRRRRLWFAAAIGGGLAISVGAYGADLKTGYSRAVAAPPRSAPAVRRSTPSRPIDPPDTELNQRAALVDQLYGELIRSSGCVLASSKASIGGGC